MTPKATNSKIDSCTHQLHTWKPFDPSFNNNPKKPCLSNRSTAPNNLDTETLDLSKLSLIADDPPNNDSTTYRCWFHHRKRRRRGSRSVSGRSSDRSGTHHRASATYATCSDFPLAAGGTDSSGELFVNNNGGEGSWGSDNASEVRVLRKEMEKESYGFQGGNEGLVMLQGGNELSGYGSEPGYRGDGELGDGDEFDEEEEDGKLMFWGDRFGGGDTDPMEIVEENKFSEQKVHHRCRRKKHDWRFIAPLR